MTADELGECADHLTRCLDHDVGVDRGGVAVVLELDGQIPRLVDDCFEVRPKPAGLAEPISEEVGPSL
jgi:hypothetical protein